MRRGHTGRTNVPVAPTSPRPLRPDAPRPEAPARSGRVVTSPRSRGTVALAQRGESVPARDDLRLERAERVAEVTARLTAPTSPSAADTKPTRVAAAGAATTTASSTATAAAAPLPPPTDSRLTKRRWSVELLELVEATGALDHRAHRKLGASAGARVSPAEFDRTAEWNARTLDAIGARLSPRAMAGHDDVVAASDLVEEGTRSLRGTGVHVPSHAPSHREVILGTGATSPRATSKPSATAGARRSPRPGAPTIVPSLDAERLATLKRDRLEPPPDRRPRRVRLPEEAKHGSARVEDGSPGDSSSEEEEEGKRDAATSSKRLRKQQASPAPAAGVELLALLRQHLNSSTFTAAAALIRTMDPHRTGVITVEELTRALRRIVASRSISSREVHAAAVQLGVHNLPSVSTGGADGAASTPTASSATASSHPAVTPSAAPLLESRHHVPYLSFFDRLVHSVRPSDAAAATTSAVVVLESTAAREAASPRGIVRPFATTLPAPSTTTGTDEERARRRVLELEEAVQTRLRVMEQAPQSKSAEEVIAMFREKALSKHIMKIFRAMDLNHDQHITRDEFQKALRAMKVELSTKEADRLVSLLDDNGDGSIDYSEFIAAVADAGKTLPGLEVGAAAESLGFERDTLLTGTARVRRPPPADARRDGNRRARVRNTLATDFWKILGRKFPDLIRQLPSSDHAARRLFLRLNERMDAFVPVDAFREFLATNCVRTLKPGVDIVPAPRERALDALPEPERQALEGLVSLLDTNQDGYVQEDDLILVCRAAHGLSAGGDLPGAGAGVAPQPTLIEEDGDAGDTGHAGGKVASPRAEEGAGQSPNPLGPVLRVVEHERGVVDSLATTHKATHAETAFGTTFAGADGDLALHGRGAPRDEELASELARHAVARLGLSPRGPDGETATMRVHTAHIHPSLIVALREASTIHAKRDESRASSPRSSAGLQLPPLPMGRSAPAFDAKNPASFQALEAMSRHPLGAKIVAPPPTRLGEKVKDLSRDTRHVTSPRPGTSAFLADEDADRWKSATARDAEEGLARDVATERITRVAEETAALRSRKEALEARIADAYRTDAERVEERRHRSMLRIQADQEAHRRMALFSHGFVDRTQRKKFVVPDFAAHQQAESAFLCAVDAASEVKVPRPPAEGRPLVKPRFSVADLAPKPTRPEVFNPSVWSQLKLG